MQADTITKRGVATRSFAVHFRAKFVRNFHIRQQLCMNKAARTKHIFTFQKL